MKTASPIDTVSNLFSAFGSSDLATARALWAEDGIWHLTGKHQRARDYAVGGYFKLLQEWVSAYPSYVCEPIQISSVGDEVVCVSLQSSGGEAPGTAIGLMVYRVVEGRIVEGWGIPAFADGRFAF